MKKALLFIASIAITTTISAGGIMTNTNQSAAYGRTLSRNASLNLDAVYYNPAGLTKLNKGFYVSLNNQTIFQTKDVVNSYQFLHDAPDAKFTGDVKAPLFPGAYLAYKTGKFAFSFGFNPVGGGGGATYATGLPSFEIPVSELVPSLASFGVSDYQASINFEGTSVYFGYQAGVSYEINPAVSVFAGVRYVTAKNTYVGALKNIMINPNIPNTSFNGSFVRADLFGTQMSSYYSGVATQMTQAAAGLDPLVVGGAGGLTPAQAAGMGIITAQQQAVIEGGLAAIGQPNTLTIAQAQGAFTTVAAQATAGSLQMAGLAAKTADAEVDAEQTATGWTPVLGLNLTLAEKLTLAFKYEPNTKIELTNATKVDGTGKFVDGAKSRADMPAMFAFGAAYPVSKKLSASLSFNYYFDKNSDYGKTDAEGLAIKNADLIDNDFYELGLGLEYNLTDAFMLSAGYLMANTGVSKDYQTDLSYSLSSNTVGFGGQYKITPDIAVNLGFLNVFYGTDNRTFERVLGGNTFTATEDYAKSTWMVAAGIDFKLGK